MYSQGGKHRSVFPGWTLGVRTYAEAGTLQGTEQLLVDTSAVRPVPQSADVQLAETSVGLGVDMRFGDCWQQAIIATDRQSEAQVPGQDVQMGGTSTWVLLAGLYLQLAILNLKHKGV